MRKSTAKKRYEKLRFEFDRDYARDCLEEKLLRGAWMERAQRLASDAFGTQDALYADMQKCKSLSTNYDAVTQIKKPLLGARWFNEVEIWLDKLSVNIESSDKLEPFIVPRKVLYTLFVAIVVVLVTFSLKECDSEKTPDSNLESGSNLTILVDEYELSKVKAEFEFWAKGAQRGQIDSVKKIANGFASRNMYHSGFYLKAVIDWGERKRFSIDSARSSYFARINALGGDTTKLQAPRQLSVNLMRFLSVVSKELDYDLRYWGVDTL